jgi:hypothetical protein
MPQNLRGRSFIKLLDFTPDEIRHLLRLAASLKTVICRRRQAEDTCLSPIGGRAKFLRNLKTALAVQLFLKGSEKHALPNRVLRPAPEIPSRRGIRRPIPTLQHWDNMG